ncbi:MAG: hypothetical protein RLN75_05130 [Longimicrobiales bacterium]
MAALHRAGARLLVETDSGIDAPRPGLSLVDEMLELRTAGLGMDRHEGGVSVFEGFSVATADFVACCADELARAAPVHRRLVRRLEGGS